VRSLIAIVIVLLSTSAVQAQSADSVPRELAVALLREPGGGVRLIVGTTPERFPLALTPADSKVLGALQRELTTTVVFVSKSPLVKSQRDWERQLESAGWTRPPGYTAVATNGLVSSELTASFPVFCSSGRFASLDGTTRYDGGSTLLVQYSEPTAQSLCATSRSVDTHDTQIVVTRDSMPLPALMPPVGAVVVALPVRTTVDKWEQQASLSGTLSHKSVLEHYVQQLVKSGFAAGAPANLDATSLQTFRRTMPDSGFQLFASILVTANPFDTTEMTVQLTVFRRR
jgi:hypothetical protein